MDRLDSCAYDVYLRVFEWIRCIRESGDARDLQDVAANLDALAGAGRLAAGLAKVDAQAERAARVPEDVCRCICDRFDCARYPRAGG